MKTLLGTCHICKHPCSGLTNICPPCLSRLEKLEYARVREEMSPLCQLAPPPLDLLLL